MLLVIDNYDSFVHNLARCLTLTGWDCDVVRNDAVTLEDVERLNPEAIVLSPGPCTPKEAGTCLSLIERFGPHTPLLGVCLGHQCIGEAYGGTTIRAAQPVHGRASEITHDGSGLFVGLPSPLAVGRYHSLITDLPPSTPLRVTARSDNGEIMALEHTTHPVHGVQFHPESILTPHGQAMLENFTAIARAWNSRGKQAA
ncbi:MAG: aminodeoxychorismate/anthranilate synthase component II [Alphaproteobacteria bacterium]|nr:aminodeoxychorismate/anthranilate synthase component II [Alphaproteobacteria bacterium]